MLDISRMPKDFFTADWFPYYHERFEDSDSVALMSAAEEGAYHRAIRWAWKKRSLPKNVEVFAAKIRCTVKVTEKVLKTFVPDPDDPKRVLHPVVEEIRSEQEQKYLNRRKGGKASAEARKKSESVNAENKGELNNTEQCSNNTPTRIENRDKREEEKNGAKPPDENPEAAIWNSGKSLLSRSGLDVRQAGAFLGKLVKDHGKDAVATAVSVTLANNAADPKTYLIAVLQKRATAPALVGKHVAPPQQYKCEECHDLGEVTVPDPDGGFSFSVKEIPCPQCRRAA